MCIQGNCVKLRPGRGGDRAACACERAASWPPPRARIESPFQNTATHLAYMRNFSLPSTRSVFPLLYLCRSAGGVSGSTESTRAAALRQRLSTVHCTRRAHCCHTRTEATRRRGIRLCRRSSRTFVAPPPLSAPLPPVHPLHVRHVADRRRRRCRAILPGEAQAKPRTTVPDLPRLERAEHHRTVRTRETARHAGRQTDGRRREGAQTTGRCRRTCDRRQSERANRPPTESRRRYPRWRMHA